MADDESAAVDHVHLVVPPPARAAVLGCVDLHPDLAGLADDLVDVGPAEVVEIGVPREHLDTLRTTMATRGWLTRPAMGGDLGQPVYELFAEPSLLPADPISAEDFAALAHRVVLGPVRNRYIAALPDALPALAEFAQRYEELAQVAEVIEYDSPNLPRAEGVSLIRISARWEELLAWARDSEWRIMRIPGAVREPVEEGGITGPVFLMQRRKPIPPNATAPDW